LTIIITIIIISVFIIYFRAYIKHLRYKDYYNIVKDELEKDGFEEITINGKHYFNKK